MSLDPIRERIAERHADQLISELQITELGDIDIEAITMTRKALVIDGG
jgi:hypothetical protein